MDTGTFNINRVVKGSRGPFMQVTIEDKYHHRIVTMETTMENFMQALTNLADNWCRFEIQE